MPKNNPIKNYGSTNDVGTFITKAVFRALGDSGETKKTRFEVSFSSETPRILWNGYKEILIHSAEAVKLDRLKEVGVALFAHGYDKNFGSMPVGKLEDIQLDEVARRCTATIVFDEDDDKSMYIAGKIERGFINGISVGAKVKKWIRLEADEQSADGRFEGPAYLASEWEPFEISVAPTPADPSVGIGRSVNFENNENMEGEKMPFGKYGNGVTKNASGQLPTATSPEGEVSLNRAVELERERASAISEICKSFGFDSDEYIKKGVTVDEVNRDILKKLSAERPPVKGVSVVKDEGDKFRSAATDGLLLRAGIKPGTISEGAESFRGMRLRDLAIESLTRSGISGANRMDDNSLLKSALTPGSAFGSIVSNVVDKTMLIEYAAAPSTFEKITSRSTYTDFKPKEMYQISEAGDLEQIQENGEIKFDSGSDVKTTGQLLTFGKEFGFTRQSLINDDLDILTKRPAAYVRAAKRGINKAVYNIIKNNPMMMDGHALFSGSHSNLGTDGKPSVETYNELMGMMMLQKGLKGKEVLNIPPKFVLCDPMQYASHASILNSTANPASPNSGAFNPFMGLMELVVDAELYQNGSKPFYFAASPNECPGIDVGYLNGNDAPQLEYQVGFDYLGIKYRIMIDYAVTLVDYRAFAKNNGSN